MYFRGNRKSAQDVSLSDCIEVGSDGAPLELMDVISAEGDLFEELDKKEDLRRLKKALTVLTPQEEAIITLRYGLSGEPPLRQREVAARTGISRSYVSRIEKRALEKLKRAMDSPI